MLWRGHRGTLARGAAPSANQKPGGDCPRGLIWQGRVTMCFFIRYTLFIGLSARSASGLSTGRRIGEDVNTDGQSALSSFQVGSFEGGADAVLAGNVQSAWLPASPALVAPEEGRTRLWALLANMAAPEVPLEEVSVASADPSVATASLQWRSGGPRDGEQLAVGSTLRPLVTDVVYQCRRGGAAGLVVAYRFADPQLAPIELSITKECTQRPRVGLCLGTSAEDSDNVVHNGRSRWDTSTAMHHIIPAEQSRVDLYWTLRPSTDTASQLLSPPLAHVTPLATGRVPDKVPGVADLRRWNRRLSARSAQEAKWHEQGAWGLLQEEIGSGATAHANEIVRVRFAGALQDGGALPVESSLPAHASPPTLSIELQCLRLGVALVQVEVAPFPAYQPYRPAIVAFLKECGGRVLGGFEVATHPMAMARVNTEVSIKADVLRSGESMGRLRDVSNLKNTVEVYWRSSPGSPRGPPDSNTLTCNGGLVDAFVAQPLVTARSEESSELAGRLAMHFRCKQAGISACTLKFGWRLFEGPTLKFRKVCGGVRSDVDITSDMPSARLVLLQGKDQAGWGLNPQVSLPAEEDKTTFTVSLDRALQPGEQVLSVAPPQIHVFRPDVLKAAIVGDLAEGGEVDSTVDGSADVEVVMQCVKSGTSRVEVTLPIGSFEPFKPLSFAFTKKCTVIEYWQQWWFIAIASFGGLFFLSTTVMGVCVFSFQSKLSEQLKRAGNARELDGVEGEGNLDAP
mmetsp:Transcript_120650/g.209490  ORF Transcript_120650/g.209490 Transcript_120650/m.209490 type:complete len:740 (+) Transcript_120650:43-2262(+)